MSEFESEPELFDWEMPEALRAPPDRPAVDTRQSIERATDGAIMEAQRIAVWTQAYRRQRPRLEPWACREYLDGFEILNLPEDRIPQLDELNGVITPRTGWRTIRTPIRYSDALPWYRRFARREFLVTNYMRSPEELEFTPEPDMFHDMFGHLPFLTLPLYAELVEMFAAPFLRADEAAREDIKRLAWFSTEFGLIREDDKIKAFGAGLISSIGELASVMAGRVPLEPFTLEAVLGRDKAIWSQNEVLFVFDSLDALRDELGRFFDRV